jgi:hypothetical protein
MAQMIKEAGIYLPEMPKSDLMIRLVKHQAQD